MYLFVSVTEVWFSCAYHVQKKMVIFFLVDIICSYQFSFNKGSSEVQKSINEFSSLTS